MSITSYAQNFEDVMLWRALGHVANGFYIDLGAQHPITDSVSKAFYEKGWRGIHVEATPAYAALLRQDRPDEIVIEAAVNDVHGVINFYEIPSTGISTGDKDIAQSHKERGFEVREIAVPCVTLQDIFNQAGARDIHWLKVDVENMELQVLRSWEQSPHRPWVVVVESTVPLTQTDNHLPWAHCLLERGYTHAYFDGLNRYYIAADQQQLAAAFATGPHVFDGFTLHGGASATFCAGINEKHRLEQQALQEKLSAKEQEALHLQEQKAAEVASHQAIEREWQLKLQTLQSERKEAEHTHALKELALQQLANQTYQQAQSQAQSHLQTLLQREQESAAQLQALQSELSAAHQTAHQRTLALEAQASKAIQEAQTELKNAITHAQARFDALAQSLFLREKEWLAEKARLQQSLEQTHAKSENHLQTLALREREFAKQLHELKAEQHQKQLAWTGQQKDLSHEIDRLKSELQTLQASAYRSVQQHEFELKNQMTAHQSALAACAALEAQLKAEVFIEQQNSQQLTLALAEVRLALAATQAPWSWRSARFIKRLANILPAWLSTRYQKIKNFISKMLRVSQLNALNNTHHQQSTEEMHNTDLNKNAKEIPHISVVYLLHGSSFIKEVYRIFLEREPDEAGMNYYLTRLRIGVGKSGVISEVARSLEARKKNKNISGVSEIIKAEKRKKLWLTLWGGFFGSLTQSINALDARIIDISEKNQLELINIKQSLGKIEINLKDMETNANIVNYSDILTREPTPVVAKTNGFQRAIPRSRDINEILIRIRRNHVKKGGI